MFQDEMFNTQKLNNRHWWSSQTPVEIRQQTTVPILPTVIWMLHFKSRNCPQGLEWNYLLLKVIYALSESMLIQCPEQESCTIPPCFSYYIKPCPSGWIHCRKPPGRISVNTVKVCGRKSVHKPVVPIWQHRSVLRSLATSHWGAGPRSPQPWTVFGL